MWGETKGKKRIGNNISLNFALMDRPLTIAPIAIIARSAICHSGLFSDTIITRSPFKIPALKSVSANCLIFSRTSVHVKDLYSLLIL